MKEFLDDLSKQKVLRKEDSATWLSPVFCYGKKDGEIRLLTDLRKLNDTLERDEWPFKTIDSILSSIEKYNYITTLDQVIGYYVIKVNDDDQQYLDIVMP